MKKFFWIFFSLILVGGIGFATWFFVFRKDDRLTIEFYGEEEIVSCLSGDGKYKEGSVVMLKAKTRDGYVFDAWIKENDVVSNMQNYSFIMTKETAGKYTARYTPLDYTISNENQGNIHVAQTARMGELVVVNFNLPQGFEIEEMYYIIEGTEEKTLILGNRFIMPAGDIQVFVSIIETKYTITYDLQGGDFEGERIDYYTINTPTFNLPEPVKEGFTFIGWTDDIITSPAMVYQVAKGCMKNFEVTANWERNTYNITTQTTGEGTIEVVGSGLFEENVTVTITAEDGYFLSRLYYIIDGQETEVDIEETFSIPAGNITVYAVFAKVEYTITAVVEDCEFTIENPIASVGDDVVVVATPPQGYEVSRYYYICEGSTDEVEFDQTFVMPTNNVEVHVEMTATLYTITYYTDDGVLPTEYTQSYTIEDEVTLPVPTKDYHDFDGWFENDEFTGDIVTTFENQTGNKYFYAKYTIHSYTIIFANYDGTELESSKVNHGSMPEYKGQNPTRPMTAEYEYEFAGWDSEIVAATQVTTYTATYTQLARQYTITKATTNNGTLTASNAARVGETVAISTAANMGYTLARLYYVDGNGNRVDFTTSFVMPTSDVTVYAEFAKTQYTITKAATTNGSFTAPTSASQGDEVTIVALPNSYCEIIRMYYKEEGKTNEVAFDGSFTMPSANITIYVEFAKIEYTITKAVTANGSFSVALCATYGTDITVTIDPDDYYRLARSYYVLEDGGDEVEFSDGFTMPGGHVIVYVEFTKIDYVITKGATTNGSFNVSSSANYGDTVSVSATPNDDYEISRMYYIASGTTTEVPFSGSFTMPGNNVTVYVVFEETITTYTISKTISGTGEVECAESAEPGETVTLNLSYGQNISWVEIYYLEMPTSNKVSIFNESVSIGSSLTQTFIMPSCNIDLKIRFGNYIGLQHESGCSVEAVDYAIGGELVSLIVTSDYKNYYVSEAYYIGMYSGLGNDKVDLPEPVEIEEGVLRFTFEMPSEAIDLYIIINEQSFDITTNASHATVDVNSAALAGEVVSVNATPNDGFKITKMYYVVDGNTDSKVGFVDNFTMPEGEVTVYVETESTTSVPSGITYSFEVIANDETLGWTEIVSVTPRDWTCKLQAIPYEWAKFEGWSTELGGEIVSTDFVYIGDFAAHTTFYATFSQKRVTIIGKAPTSNGSFVVASSAVPTSTVTVTATPDAGYKVARMYYNSSRISGDVEVEFDGSFTMPNKNIIVYVEFEPVQTQFTITKAATTNGSFTAPSSATQGETVNVTFTPDDGYVLGSAYYIVNGVSTQISATNSFIMPSGNTTITAEFYPQVTVSVSGCVTESFVISQRPGTQVTFTIDLFDAEQTEIVALYTDPSDGSQEWLSGSRITDTKVEYYITMPTSPTTINIEYSAVVNEYNITIAYSTNGSVSCASQAYEGDTVVVTTTPDEDFEAAYVYFENLQGDEIDCDYTWLSENSLSFTMPSFDVVIYIGFEEIPYYPISVSSATGGSVVCPTRAEVGDIVSFEIRPDVGYELQSLTAKNGIDGSNISVNLTTNTFVMPEDQFSAVSVLLTPVFVKTNYTITKVVGNGTVTINNTATYNEVVNVSFSAYENYKISERYYIAEGSTERVNFTNSFTMPANNITVYVTFVAASSFTITKVTPTNGDYSCPSSARYNDEVVVSLSIPTPALGVYIYYIEETSNEMETIYCEDFEQAAISFTMPNDNITLYVEYLYYVGINAVNCDIIDGDGSEAYAGEVVSFALHKSNSDHQLVAAYYIGRVSGTRGEVVYDGAIFTQHEFSFTMPAEPVDVYIKYAATSDIYRITVASTEFGTIECDSVAIIGDNVLVTATPNDGYTLAKTYYIMAGTTEEVEFVDFFEMPNKNITVYADFEPIQARYTISKQTETLGTIDVVSSAIAGTTINVTATPNDCYEVSRMYYVLDGTTAQVEFNGSFTMPESDLTIYVDFELIDSLHTITIDGVGLGTIEVICASFAEGGSQVSLTLANGGPGETLTDLYYYGKSTKQYNTLNPVSAAMVLFEETFYFTMPEEDIILYVVVGDLNGYGQTLTTGEMENGTISCLRYSRVYANINVYVFPNEGYELSRTYYIAEGTTEEVEFTGSFNMPNNNVTVYAEFSLIPVYYDITINTSSSDPAYVEGPTTAAVGDTVQLKLIKRSNCSIDQLTCRGETSGNIISVDIKNFTFVMPGENVIITVSYGPAAPSYTIETQTQGSGLVTCLPTATVGSTVVVDIRPNENYEVIEMYYVTKLNNEQVYFTDTFTMPMYDVTVYVVFETYYSVTIGSAANGSISVESRVRPGHEFSIVATPNQGYNYSSGYVTDAEGNKLWDLTGAASDLYVMPEKDIIIYATFTPKMNTISVGAMSNGEVSVASYAQTGSTVTVTATPDSGYRATRLYYVANFDGAEEVEFTNSFTMPGYNVTVYAEFSFIYYITVSQPSHGRINTVSSAVGGEEIIINVISNEGYRFDSGSILIVENETTVTFTDATYDYIMPESDIIISAIFVALDLTITKGATTNGSFAVQTLATSGDTVQVSATPNEGYALGRTYYIAAGTTTEVEFNGSFTMPTRNVTVYVEFAKLYNIVVEKIGSSMSSVTCQSYAAAGAQVALDVEYEGPGLTVIDMYYYGKTSKQYITANAIAPALDISDTFYFTMPEEDIILWVVLGADSSEIASMSTITTQATNGKIICARYSYPNRTINVYAEPNAGYTLSRTYYIVEGTTEEVDFEGSFAMPTSSITVYAVFTSDETDQPPIDNSTYTITVREREGYTISSPTSTAAAGEAVWINVSGEDLYGISISDENGDLITFSSAANGQAPFTMPSKNVVVYPITTMEYIGG